MRLRCFHAGRATACDRHDKVTTRALQSWHRCVWSAARFLRLILGGTDGFVAAPNRVANLRRDFGDWSSCGLARGWGGWGALMLTSTRPWPTWQSMAMRGPECLRSPNHLSAANQSRVWFRAVRKDFSEALGVLDAVECLARAGVRVGQDQLTVGLGGDCISHLLP